MKKIISISTGSHQRDYSTTISLLGETYAIQRFGTDGDTQHLANVIQQYDGHADVLCLEGIAPLYRAGHTSILPPYAARLLTQPTHTPIVDGSLLKSILGRWSIKRANDAKPNLFRNQRILILDGLEHYAMAQCLLQYDAHIRFADPIMQTGWHLLPPVRSLKHLELYATVVLPLLARFGGKQDGNISSKRTAQTMLARMQQRCQWAHIIIGHFETIATLPPESLRGRTIITNDPSPKEVEVLRQADIKTLITHTPRLNEEHPFVSTEILAAMIAAYAIPSSPSHASSEADILDFITKAQWAPTFQQLAPTKPKPTFAFVVHPLTIKQIFKDRRFRFARFLPLPLVEWMAASLPPLTISRIRGIRSLATGETVEGILMALGATPREMMRRPPKHTYKRLIHAAAKAEGRGAKIMGLGAFTSVVGDAGVTVAKQSNIGITSGNSLTVAATLEAARYALSLMGEEMAQSRAMVIGATGSIGAACAKILAAEAHEIVLVAPRYERLLDLKIEIEQETEHARVIATTQANSYLSKASLIITTTNTLQGRLIDMKQLKPGAVICDVARPPNILKEEAEERPDVLVIESGEMLLPGEPDFGIDIDLPPGTAYACLAETALLAMEGAFESYTLGRNIRKEQVLHIHRLMHKHGLKLADLRSFGQHITSEQIAEKRRLSQTYETN